MPRLITHPAVTPAKGSRAKQIEEFAGRVNSAQQNVSVARVIAAEGWRDAGQRPDFEEVTIVLKGMLRVEHQGGVLKVHAGQAVITSPGEWVCYSSPEPGGAEYIAVCTPAFSPESANRDAS